MGARREGIVRLCEVFAKTKDNITVWLVSTLSFTVV